MNKHTISAITGNSTLANFIHVIILIIVAGMIASIIYAFDPLYLSLVEENRWEGVGYLIIICVLIPVYWPSLVYRMIIILMLPFPFNIRKFEYNLIEKNKLPPISIVIAVRNEPASLVIPLLRSLVTLEYPDYEIVIADNSDIILSDNRLNEDFLQIVSFAERNHIRLCRRDCGEYISEVVANRNWSLVNYREKGDINGGKAANLNLAFGSSDERFKWFIILDSDSMLPERAIREMITIGVSGGTRNREVGFVQSILLSQNYKESSVSHALTLIDEPYYRYYFKVKASLGVISNFGHGVLISRVAWQATKGFPLEISEDLAWAIELALTGKFINYYAECYTLEGKPPDWKALKVQRDRWAKGTTLLLKKQFWPLWKTKKLCFSEKMDLSYDMMSYSLNALGCCIPVIFMVSGLLGPNGKIVFKTFIPIFYFSLLIDNILLPLHSIKIALSGNIRKSRDVINSVPIVSIYMGGISSQVLISVVKAFLSGRWVFLVTPKLKTGKTESFWSIIKDNKICYLLFFINGWVAISGLDFYPPIVPLLAISPMCYFFAPILGSRCR